MNQTLENSGLPVMSPKRQALLALDDEGLLRATQKVYEIPSLAAWRASELKVLRCLDYPGPVLEIGCGSGLFAQLLFDRIECGIDLSPREVAVCRRGTHIYGRVVQMDARQLEFQDGTFSTVFANCVIEHIPDLQLVLKETRRVLKTGGKFISTVPLKNMERHLLFSHRIYTGWRAAVLCHVNLLTSAAWRDAFANAGFRRAELTPYLPSALCQRWDNIDGPICVGSGRFRAGQLYRYTMRALPSAARARINASWRSYFASALAQDPAVDTCAVAIEAVA